MLAGLTVRVLQAIAIGPIHLAWWTIGVNCVNLSHPLSS